MADVWGGRSGLRFVDGQSNKDVLWHELSMIDVMVANRDMSGPPLGTTSMRLMTAMFLRRLQ